MANQEVILGITGGIVTAAISTGQIVPSEIAALIASTYSALDQATSAPLPTLTAPTLEPAVPVRASIKRDYLVCLEDGAKLKMLKRYLRTHYAMTPEEYRAKWGLPRDYPMVAPAYAEKRRELAVQIGLGRKTPTPTPAKPARKAA